MGRCMHEQIMAFKNSNLSHFWMYQEDFKIGINNLFWDKVKFIDGHPHWYSCKG